MRRLKQAMFRPARSSMIWDKLVEWIIIPLNSNNVATRQFPSPFGFQLTIDQHLAILDHQFRLPAGAGNAAELEELIEPQRFMLV